MEQNTIKAHVFIQGSVQGVFFRSWAKKTADEFGIVGWVKNLEDGRVEAVLQGQQKDVEKMLELCKVGSDKAQVTHLDVIIEDPEEGFYEFKILKNT